MTEELSLEDVAKIIEEQRSWCNHDDVFEVESPFPVEHSYIFQCRCGKTSYFKPTKEMVQNIKKYMSYESNTSEVEIEDLFGVKLIHSKRINIF